MASNYRLKVGIDLGATFSAVSWVYTLEPDEVNVVIKWPGASGRLTTVPSQILYTPDGAVHKWGYQLKFPDQPIVSFKLLLFPSMYSSADSRMVSKALSLPSGKELVDIVADYLCCLRLHFLEIISGRIGKACIDATPIDYTLTVPAIWNDSAKSLMLKAAEKAGLGSLNTMQLMSEPEAAAAWIILREITPNNLKVGDAFVVGDCGASTVDLVSYEVQGLNPLIVNQCTNPTGGLCGSVSLDNGFLDHVKSRIGVSFNKINPGTRNRMLNEWESVMKPGFSHSIENQSFSCPVGSLPDDYDMGIFNGEIILDRQDMLAILDPVISKVVELVQEQINMVAAMNDRKLRISTLLLVGGFGQSKYLKHRLETELTEGPGSSNSAMQILQMTNGAAALGAALGTRIISRKARRHYGVSCSVDYIHGLHPLETLYIDLFTGDAKCNNIHWFIKKGEYVPEDIPMYALIQHMVGINERLEFESTVYSCDEDEVPEFPDGVDRLSSVCSLKLNGAALPRGMLVRKTGLAGDPYYEISYNLTMTIGSDAVHFGLIFQGKNYGTVKMVGLD